MIFKLIIAGLVLFILTGFFKAIGLSPYFIGCYSGMGYILTLRLLKHI